MHTTSIVHIYNEGTVGTDRVLKLTADRLLIGEVPGNIPLRCSLICTYKGIISTAYHKYI